MRSMPIGYYKEEFEDHKQRRVQLLNLRHLTRQFDSLTQMYVQVKLQFQAVLDQVFCHLISLVLYINLLLQYQEHLSHLRSQIDALAEEVEAYQIIQSIPGIGGKIAATILSEIGEIHRFNNAKKLVVFAGIDPSVYASGKFTATSNRITKRGSKKLRHALYLAVLCGLRKTGSKRLREFYDKKREAGKPYRVALIACVNKLLHWIYAMIVKQERFVDLA